MKLPIIAFLLVFIVSGGIPSITDDAMSELSSDSGTTTSLFALNDATAENDAATTPRPNSAAMLLVATGLIGLVGVTRRKNS